MNSRPNILLVFPDQVRADWIEPTATAPVRTPHLKTLAQHGVLFRKCWTPSPICAPARACMACGVEYDRSPVKNNGQNVPPGTDTLYRRLSRSGYEVSTVGKLDLLKGFMDWGEDGRHATTHGGSRLEDLGFTGGVDSAGKHDCLVGFEKGIAEPFMTYLNGQELGQAHFDDYRQKREPGEQRDLISAYIGRDTDPPPAYSCLKLSPLPDDAYGDNWVGRQGLKELRRLLHSNRPWFLTVNFPGPHEPLDITASMQARWRDVDFPMPYGRPVANPGLHCEMRRRYAAMINLIDDWLGVYISELQRASLLENTLVVYASDHGEMLGDLNLWGKSVPHEASIGVPLVMAGRAAESAICDAPVSLLDMCATFLDVAGADAAGYEGASLRPVLEGQARPQRDLVYSGLGHWRAVSDGRFKLVAGWRENVVAVMTQFGEFDKASIDGAKLFDLDADPHEECDVSTAYPEIHRRLAAALIDAIGPGGEITSGSGGGLGR